MTDTPTDRAKAVLAIADEIERNGTNATMLQTTGWAGKLREIAAGLRVVSAEAAPDAAEAPKPDEALAFDIEDAKRTATMLRTYGPEIFGLPNEQGQVHFGQAVMDSAADQIDAALSRIAELERERDIMRAAVSPDWRDHEKARGKLSLMKERAEAAEQQLANAREDRRALFDENCELEQQLATARAALGRAVRAFRGYEARHKGKCTAEGQAKAEANAALADEMEAALAVQGEVDPLDDLVTRFSAALLAKLRAAREKYGYKGERWQEDGWRDSLLRKVREHLEKGDPRDVAAYCAFAWHHDWSLAVQGEAPAQEENP